MRNYLAGICVGILIVLSLAPWVVQSYARRPLLPDELRLERENYEATVEAAQEATIVAMRQAPSAPSVLVIGTLGPTIPSDVASPTAVTETITVTSMATSPPGVTTVAITPNAVATQPNSNVTVSTMVAEVTATTSSDGSVSEATVPVPTLTDMPDSSITPTVGGAGVPALPSGLVDIEDVITEAMLTEQAKQDADDDSLSDLTVRLTDEGVTAIGFITVFPGIRQQLDVSGTLVVENYSLVFEVASIELEGRDVTERYRAQLESRINTSLYRLLPQRYVQSYELADGEIRVESGIRQ